MADSIAVADFNGDGIPDIAVTCPPESKVKIYLGNGDGTFTLKSSSAAGNWSNSVAVADFNGDGILDLAVANAPCCTGSITPYVTILLGNGDGTFTAAPNVPAPDGTWNVQVGDFNGDGIPDLVFTTSTGGKYSVRLLMGNGDGTFTAAASPASGSGTANVHVGDFNGDGNLDLAVLSSSNVLTFLFGNGDGTFTAAPASPVTFPYSASINLGDFNGDGILDMSVLDSSDNTLRFMLGNGDGTFATTAATPSLVSDPEQSVAGDFNGDGISDLAYTMYPVGNYTVAVLLTEHTQTATATASGISLVGAPATHQVEASYDGDVNHLGSTSGTVGLGANIPPHLAFTTPPAVGLQVGQGPGIVKVSVEDSSNNVVTTYNSTVTLTVTGPGSYAKVYMATASSGIATFSSLASLSTVGSYSYTGTDVPDGYTQAVANESVWLPHLAFTTPPAISLQVGQGPGTVKVSVEDSSNNVVTTSNSTVTLTVTGPGSYAKVYTATAASGIATFSSLAALSTAGNYSYTATDVPDGYTQAIAIEIVHGPPSAVSVSPS